MIGIILSFGENKNKNIYKDRKLDKKGYQEEKQPWCIKRKREKSESKD